MKFATKQILLYLQDYGISLSFIESRVSQSKKDNYEFVIALKNPNGHVNTVVEQLKKRLGSDVLVLSRNSKTADTSRCNLTLKKCRIK